MTISTTLNRNGPYSGNDVTVDFAWGTYQVFDADTLKVYKTVSGVTAEITTGFTKNGIPGTSGTITFTTPPATGEQITIIRESDNLQSSDYASEGRVTPEQVEEDLDRAIMALQDILETVGRGVSLDVSSTLSGLTFPSPSAGLAIGWNATADGLANITSLPTATLTASTDHAVLRYDSGTGSIIDSGVNIDDSDNVTGIAALTGTGAATMGSITLSSSDPFVRVQDTDGTNQFLDLLQVGAVAYLDLRNNTGNGALQIRGYNGGTPTEFLSLNASGALGISDGDYGTTGQVLVSKGTGAPPEWEKPTFDLIEVATVSSVATVDFEQFDNTLYDDYLFVFSNVVLATNGATLQMLTSTDGGTSYDNGAGHYEFAGNASTLSTNTTVGSASATELTIFAAAANTANVGISGNVWLFGAGQAAQTQMRAEMGGLGASNWLEMTVSGRRISAADVDAVRFLANSGNLSTGIIKMYGIRKA